MIVSGVGKGVLLSVILMVLFSSSPVYGIFIQDPDNQNFNEIFTANVVYCREIIGLDIGDDFNDGCTLDTTNSLIVDPWNSSKIQSGTIQISQLGIDQGCSPQSPCVIDYYEGTTSEVAEGSSAVRVWSHPLTPNNFCQMNFTPSFPIMNADDLVCCDTRVDGCVVPTDPTNHEITARWETDAVEDLELTFKAKTCDDIPQTGPPGTRKIYGGDLSATPDGGFLINISFISDSITTLITRETSDEFENFSFRISMEDLGVTFSPFFIDIGLGTQPDPSENVTCVVYDDLDLQIVPEIEPRRNIISQYVENVTDLTFGFPTSNIVNSGSLSAGNLVLFVSKLFDQTALARLQYDSSSVTAFSGTDVVNICKDTACVLKIGQTGNAGLRQERINVSGVPGRVTKDFLIYNLSQVSAINVVRQQIAGTVDVLFDMNGPSLLSTRGGVFDNLDDVTETYNTSQTTSGNPIVPDIFHYPIVFFEYGILDNGSANNFITFSAFNLMQDNVVSSVTFDLIDSATGGILVTTSESLTFFNNTKTSHTISFPIDPSIGDIVRTTMTHSEGFGGATGTMAINIEHNFTVTEEALVAVVVCTDLDGDGRNDDRQIINVISTGLFQVFNELDSPECPIDVITDPDALALEESLQGSFRTVGQSIQALIDLATTNFTEGTLLLIWAGIAIIIGFGILRRLGEVNVDGGPYAIIASNLFFISGFLLKNSVTSARFVSGFFVIMYIILSAFVFWFFYRRTTG